MNLEKTLTFWKREMDRQLPTQKSHGVERIEELLAHPDLLTPQVMAFARRNRYEGVGCCEAPRGTLFHHYKVKQGGSSRSRGTT
jgi:coenzyme F420-reducing hydrogenase alpha subunit